MFDKDSGETMGSGDIPVDDKKKQMENTDSEDSEDSANNEEKVEDKPSASSESVEASSTEKEDGKSTTAPEIISSSSFSSPSGISSLKATGTERYEATTESTIPKSTATLTPTTTVKAHHNFVVSATPVSVAEESVRGEEHGVAELESTATSGAARKMGLSALALAGTALVPVLMF